MKKLMGFSLQLAKLLFLFLLLPSLSSISAQTKIRQLGVPFKMRDLAKRFIYESTNTTIDTLDIPFLRGNGAGLTGITGATGGVANTDNTTIGADTDIDGTGTLVLQTQLTDRWKILPTGEIVQDKRVYLPQSADIPMFLAALDNYDEIILPEKVFTNANDTTVSIYNKQKKTIIGAGIGRTIFKAASGAAACFRVVNSDSITLKGISFYGGNWGVVHFDTVTAITFEQNEVAYGLGMGIRKGDNVKIYANTIHDNTGTNSAHAIEFFKTVNSTAELNNCFNNEGVGVEAWDSQGISIIGNNLSGNGVGINLNGYLGPSPPAGIGARFCTVVGNTSINDIVGIKLGGNSAHNTIVSNTIDNIDINGNGFVFDGTSQDSSIIAHNNIISLNIITPQGTHTVFQDKIIRFSNGDGWNTKRILFSPNADISLAADGIRILRGGISSSSWTNINTNSGATNIVATYTGGGNGIMRFYVGDSTNNNLAAQIYGNGGVAVGEPTGGSKGDETLNVGAGVYQDGNPLLIPNGVTAGAEYTYGTNDAFGINFETNNVQRIQIGNSGDVTFTGDLIVDGTGEAKGLGALTGTAHAQTTSGATVNLFQYTTASDRNYYIKATYSAINTVNSEGAVYELTAGFRNIAGTLTQIGATTVVASLEDDAAWDANLNIAGTSIQFRIVGDASDICEWQLKYNIETITR